MLSLRHSIGNVAPLESLARNSKSVPHFRCYASPPRTEIYAQFMALRFQLVPLNTRMQDIQYVVKDFVEREFGLWPCFGSLQMGSNVSVKVFTRDLGRNPIVDK